MRRLAASLVLLAIPVAVSAQDPQNRALGDTFRSVARQWATSSPNAVARHLSPEGVQVDLSGGPMGPLGERQATALLRQLFEEDETVRVELALLQRVGGNPPRAYGSIIWLTRPRGTEALVRRTVYFGLQWVRGAWMISEIRLIP